MGKKYQYKDRAGYKDALARAEQDVTLHRICLDAILRDEFIWTETFRADNGAWFQMGIARCTSAHGGIVLVREYYPTNKKPSQWTRWADSWLREVGEYFATYCPLTMENETHCYRSCFFALRSLYNQLSQVA